MFQQQLIQGLAIGSVYGLIGIGYVLIWNAWGVLNFAQGEIAMIGAFSVLMIHVWLGIPILLAFPLAILLSMAIGYFIEITSFRPLVKADNTRKLIATIGIGIFLRNLYRVIFGADPYPFPTIFGDTPFQVGKLLIIPQNIWSLAIGFGLVVLLGLFLKGTTMGKSMRATAQDREAALLMGINVKGSLSMTFILASGLGAIAGMLMAPMYFVMADMGVMMGPKGFAVAVLGGLESMTGAMIGGIVLGILESLGAAYISSAYQSAIAFFVLFIVLVFKPSGIMGSKM
jgi:branched-chain amino acid transport system permease protein